MELFVYKNPCGRKRDVTSDELMKRSLFVYRGKRNLSQYPEPIILRGEKGKPYFANIEQGVSLSHSGDYVVCAIAEGEIGVDLEFARKVDVNAVARRYFTENESLYCKEKGEAGFFEVWTRKEAIIKYFGTTLSFGLSGIDTTQYNLESEPMRVFSIDLLENCYCAIATDEKNDKKTGEIDENKGCVITFLNI